jgi:hypothetical protein
MLWIIAELDDIEMPVGTTHQMSLRPAAHPAYVLNGNNRQC